MICRRITGLASAWCTLLAAGGQRFDVPSSCVSIEVLMNTSMGFPLCNNIFFHQLVQFVSQFLPLSWQSFNLIKPVCSVYEKWSKFEGQLITWKTRSTRRLGECESPPMQAISYTFKLISTILNCILASRVHFVVTWSIRTLTSTNVWNCPAVIIIFGKREWNKLDFIFFVATLLDNFERSYHHYHHHHHHQVYFRQLGPYHNIYIKRNTEKLLKTWESKNDKHI